MTVGAKQCKITSSRRRSHNPPHTWMGTFRATSRPLGGPQCPTHPFVLSRRRPLHRPRPLRGILSTQRTSAAWMLYLWHQWDNRSCAVSRPMTSMHATWLAPWPVMPRPSISMFRRPQEHATGKKNLKLWAEACNAWPQCSLFSKCCIFMFTAHSSQTFNPIYAPGFMVYRAATSATVVRERVIHLRARRPIVVKV